MLLFLCKMPHLHLTFSFDYSHHFDHLLLRRQPSSEELHWRHRNCFPPHLNEAVNSLPWSSQRCSQLPPWVHISKKKDLKLFICKPLLHISPPWTHPADPPGFHFHQSCRSHSAIGRSHQGVLSRPPPCWDRVSRLSQREKGALLLAWPRPGRKCVHGLAFEKIFLLKFKKHYRAVNTDLDTKTLAHNFSAWGFATLSSCVWWFLQ